MLIAVKYWLSAQTQAATQILTLFCRKLLAGKTAAISMTYLEWFPENMQELFDQGVALDELTTANCRIEEMRIIVP